jgi:hypothetical protein
MHRKTIEGTLRAKLAKPYAGAEVVVVRGRKVPKGFRGVVRLIEKRVNRFAPQPRYSAGGWDTSELWAIVESDTAVWTVKADYLDVIPNPAAVEAAVQKALAEFDANAARAGNDLSWRSQSYQNMHFAGVNLTAYAAM